MRKRYSVAVAVIFAATVLAVGAVGAYGTLASDTQPPVTTTDVVPQYWNDVAISAHAADDEGIAYIYYEFDGAVARVAAIPSAPPDVAIALPTTTGPLITPSPSPTATPWPMHDINDPAAVGAHTLRYWAQDVNGNVGARQTVTFRVGSDEAAPVTTIAGVEDGGWYNTFVHVQLAVADVGDSGVDELMYAVDGTAPTHLDGPKPQVTLPVRAIDGTHTIAYQATDLAGNVEGAKSLTVNFDTQKPWTSASSAKVVKGRAVKLKFKVSDASPNGGTASVVIKINKNNGRVVKTIKKTVNVNVASKAKFKCRFAKGQYFFTVFATDVAGNSEPQGDAASVSLRVK